MPLFWIVLALLVLAGGGYVIYTRQQIIDKIVEEANRQGVDENLALAIAEEESNFIPRAAKDFAKTGSWGIFQLKPGAASDMAGRQIVPVMDFPNNPDLDIQLGVKYILWIGHYLSTHGHAADNDSIAAAYNEGIGNELKGVPDPQYVARVSGFYNGWVNA